MNNRNMSELDELIKMIINFDHTFMYSDSSNIRQSGYLDRDRIQDKVKEMYLNQDEHDYVINVIKIKFAYWLGKDWSLVEGTDPLMAYKISIENLLRKARD